MVHFGTFSRYKKKQKQNKERIKMMSATASGFQPIFYAATRQAFNPLLKAVPKQIRSERDLSYVGFIPRYGREHRAEFLYGRARYLLFNLDTVVDRIVKQLKRKRIPQIRMELISYLNKDFPELQKAHKSLLELTNLLSWINDDYLLSTFLFHLKLSENFVFNINVPRAREVIQTDTLNTVLEAVYDLQEEKEILKAYVVLSLDILLVWAALKAKIIKDYNFILTYEEAVSSAARALARSEPETARKVIMSEAM